MPNDNTHTLLPCPFCGEMPERWEEYYDAFANMSDSCYKHRPSESGDMIACAYCGTGFMDEDSWNTRTPAPMNDNTHTTKNDEPLLDRCKCGGEAGIDLTDFEWASSQSFHVKCLKCGVRTPIGSAKSPIGKAKATRIWNTRTPAEPKAGDWEAEVEIHTAVEIHDRFQNDGIGDTEYVRLDEVRALSSAAPRITGDSDKSDLPIASSVKISEEMVERVVSEFVDPIRGSFDRTGYDDGAEYAALEIKDRLIALLRQQGPQRSEDQQGAERKWISVDERLPEKNTPIFIRWGDEKASPDTSNLKDSRVASTRILHLMRLGKIGWWCERRVFVDTPPPFTPTQTEE